MFSASLLLLLGFGHEHNPHLLEWFWVEQKNAVEFAVRKLGNGSINYPSRNVATMEIDFLSYRPADED
jgi:hypothetical protein